VRGTGAVEVDSTTLEEGCRVDPNVFYGDEQLERLLSKGKKYEVKGDVSRAIECYVVAATTSPSFERSLTTLYLLSKLEAAVTKTKKPEATKVNDSLTTTPRGPSRAWELLRELVFSGKIPAEALAIPRLRLRIGIEISK